MDLPACTTLALAVDGHVLTVTLDRPDKLNSFDAVMRDELTAVWAAVGESPDIRCVVVTGSGRAFCTGADVAGMDGERAGEATVDAELAYLPRSVEVPVLVAVNGICAGGGLHFLAECDFAIAADTATFLDPHVSVGQVSGLEPVSLMLRVHEQAMTRMVLLGSHERVGAADALRIGLVTEVVPAADLAGRIADLAARVAAGSPSAVARSLAAVRRVRRGLVDDAMEHAWRLVQDQWDHPDAAEGPRAFGEKRPPSWGPR